MVAVFLVNWFKADITCVLANQDCEIALSNDHYHQGWTSEIMYHLLICPVYSVLLLK